MATTTTTTSESDCFLAYIKSSLGSNFALLLSSHDTISSLKKKAEAHHSSLFPHHPPIVARTIKIMQQDTIYSLPDAIPVPLFFDGACSKCFLLMDAEALPSNPFPQTPLTAHVSKGGDLPEGLLNQDADPRCTSRAPNGKLLEGTANGDTTDGEMNAHKVTPSSDRESLRAGDTMQEINAASENENTDMHLMNSSTVTGNPYNAARGRNLIESLLNQDDDTRCTSKAPNRKMPEGTTNRDTIDEEMNADEVTLSNARDSLRAGNTMQEVNAASKNENTGMHAMNCSLMAGIRDAALLLNTFSNGNESGMALQKENKKVVGDDVLSEIAGEMPIPRGNDLEDNSLNKIKSSHPSDLNCSDRVISESQIDDSTPHSLNTREDGRCKVRKSYYYGNLASDSINTSEVKKQKRKQEAVKLEDSAHGEQGKKRVRKMACKTPLTNLAQNFDNSGSNIAGSEHKTHAKEVPTSGVGDTSLEFKEKNQKEVVPEELRCQRQSPSGWHCPFRALPDGIYCYHHLPRHSNKKPQN